MNNLDHATQVRRNIREAQRGKVKWTVRWRYVESKHVYIDYEWALTERRARELFGTAPDEIILHVVRSDV